VYRVALPYDAMDEFADAKTIKMRVDVQVVAPDSSTAHAWTPKLQQLLKG